MCQNVFLKNERAVKTCPGSLMDYTDMIVIREAMIWTGEINEITGPDAYITISLIV